MLSNYIGSLCTLYGTRWRSSKQSILLCHLSFFCWRLPRIHRHILGCLREDTSSQKKTCEESRPWRLLILVDRLGRASNIVVDDLEGRGMMATVRETNRPRRVHDRGFYLWKITCVCPGPQYLISCHYRKPHCTFDLHMQSMLRLVYFATDQARRTVC